MLKQNSSQTAHYANGSTEQETILSGSFEKDRSSWLFVQFRRLQVQRLYTDARGSKNTIRGNKRMEMRITKGDCLEEGVPALELERHFWLPPYAMEGYSSLLYM